MNTEEKEIAALIGSSAKIHNGNIVKIVGCDIDMKPNEVLVKDSDGDRFWYDKESLEIVERGITVIGCTGANYRGSAIQHVRELGNDVKVVIVGAKSTEEENHIHLPERAPIENLIEPFIISMRDIEPIDYSIIEKESKPIPQKVHKNEKPRGEYRTEKPRSKPWQQSKARTTQFRRR